MQCIFCKIRDREIPKEFLYEDEDVMVFQDIHPIKLVHLLIIPKVHMTDFLGLEDDKIMSKIRSTIQQMIKEQQLENKGFKILVNGGGAQAIDHLHFHLTGPWGHKVKVI